jgi:hypothetical protein
MLVFGNVNRSLLPYLRQETYLDSLLEELNSYPFPDYNGQQSVDELNQLINLTNSISDNQELQKRFQIYDANFADYLTKILSNQGLNKDEVGSIIDELHNDITPILVKLKYYYQRIRPNQLAANFQMSLYPFPSTTADTPSYPSGHAFISKVYCSVLGNKYPKYYAQLMQLAQDCADSRLMMGLHYQSDNEFSLYVADAVMSHPEFRKKYKL